MKNDFYMLKSKLLQHKMTYQKKNLEHPFGAERFGLNSAVRKHGWALHWKKNAVLESQN